MCLQMDVEVSWRCLAETVRVIVHRWVSELVVGRRDAQNEQTQTYDQDIAAYMGEGFASMWSLARE